MTIDQRPPETVLKRHLREHHVKLVWLAQRIGLARQNLSVIVNGWASDQTTRTWAPRIAEALGRDLADLFPELAATGGADQQWEDQDTEKRDA